jgi:cytidylate kinase
MVRRQQQLGAEGGVVMEGRDIGTVVFPQAPVKIFLDAAPEVRGQRRYEQTAAAAQQGQSSLTTPDRADSNLRSSPLQEEVLRDLHARDERDRNRADSPLKPALDAVFLDSTDMTLEQVVAAAEAIVAARLEAGDLPHD